MLLLQGTSAEVHRQAQAFWEGGCCLAPLSFLPAACCELLLKALARPLVACCRASTASQQLAPRVIAAAAQSLITGLLSVLLQAFPAAL